MTSIRSRDIIGTQIAITDYDEVMDAIDSAINERDRIYICCTPASSLVAARRDPALQAALAGSRINTPDGKGVVLAARILGEQINDRVYGPDLMLAQLERAAAAGTPVWLHGGYDADALEALTSSLKSRFPGLVLVGGESPPHRPLTSAETAEAVSRINAAAPAIVWVGLGSPKQEIWMHELRPVLEAPVLIGVGAAFDFHAGRVEQAPRWMRDKGLEWIYRLMREPVRLGRRYLTTLPAFGYRVLAQRIRGK